MPEGAPGTAVQVVGGVLVTLAIYVLSLWIMNKDQLVANPNQLRPPKLKAVVLNGFIDTAAAADTAWSTVNQAATNYVSLDRSYNRIGGAQFSYSFWLQLRDTSVDNVAGKTLILRGDRHAYNWNATKTDPTTKAKTIVGSWQDVLIKCPRIRFGKTFDELVVEFNTLDSPSGGHVVVAPEPQSDDAKDSYDPTMRFNAVKLVQNRWALLTFTFEDGVAINDFENGVRVRFFLNDLLYQTSSTQSALRQNNGDFFLLPSVKTDPANIAATSSENTSYSASTGADVLLNATIGNVAYYNYALGTEEVRDTFRKGPPKFAATLQSGAVGEPLYLSEYNKLEVYNT